MSHHVDTPTIVYDVAPESFSDSAASPLQGVQARLEHLSSLSVDGIALPPIFPTSDEARLHTTDYFAVDPKLGTEADLKALCDAAKARGMRVMLSGVFDHVSLKHPWFRAAQQTCDRDEGDLPPDKRFRSFFSFDDSLAHGYACRCDDENAPELNLKNPAVRRTLFTGEKSVLHHWMNVGVAGWRIMRAEEVGYSILRDIGRSALTVEGGRFAIGDVRGFANRYTKDGLLDGVVNHYLREAVVAWLTGRIPSQQVSRVLRDLSEGYKRALIRSWNQWSSLGRPRLRTVVPDRERANLATLLSYTLPGAAHILYGDEVGAVGKGTEHSVTMRWSERHWDQEVLALYRRCGELRRELPALRVGDLIDLTPEGEEDVLAFARVTSDPRETVIVVLNRASQTRVRKLFAPVCDLPDGLRLRDLMHDDTTTMSSGTVTLEIAAQAARVLVPDQRHASGARFFRGY